MIFRSIFLTLALFLTVVLQSSLVAALPMPLAVFPLVCIVGVLLYHFLRPNIGCAWMIVGGLLLDVFSPQGPSHFIIFSLSAVLGLLLARKVFANRSLYATLGLGACMYGCNLLLHIFWLASIKQSAGHPLPLTDASAYFWGQLMLFVAGLFLAFGFTRRTALFFRQFFLLRS